VTEKSLIASPFRRPRNRGTRYGNIKLALSFQEIGWARAVASRADQETSVKSNMAHSRFR